ncbi:hypothetical protein SUGI_0010720 [Cryptomeria japonica]|uniref:uncharacterized protein LOC131041913 n=1 Tax=Cryptomeria japonica TaxID=3369 RepID=UPI002408EB0C|nr:uncharacterized protein LOC131041913 [Cryptomeria japonica]GLJ05087.1 hypothetical protein SUGI_0010720 [Cryptomeria japonica]
MAYSLATVSPNSWQLQRKSGLAPFATLPHRSPGFLYSGIKRVGRPIRPCAISGNSEEEGEGGERKKKPPNLSWLEKDSASSNSFAGWGTSDQKPPGKKFTGYLAAGAAGLVLTIGFAFASHSFFSRRAHKNQMMVPLTVTQETILSSDDLHSAVADHDREQGNLLSADAWQQKQNEETAGNLIAADAQQQKQNEETDGRTGDSNNVQETAGTDQSCLSLEEINGLRTEVGTDISLAPVTSSTINVEPKEPEFEPVDLVPITNSKDVSSCLLSDSPVVAKCDCIDNFAAVPQSEPNLVVTSESTNNAPSLVESYSEIKSVYKTSDSDAVTSLLYSETGATIQIEDMDTSVVSPVTGPNLMYLYTDSQGEEPNSEERDGSMERNLDVSSDFDYTFPSDSAIPEPTTSTELGIYQNTSATPSHVPETVEIKQFINNNETPLASETVPVIVVTDFSGSFLVQETSASGRNEKDEAVGLADIENIDFNATRTSTFQPLSSESECSFPSPGIPAPSRPALHVAPGKVVVPPVVDHLQGQAFAALQALKVVEAGIEPNGLCARRDYARWLISASAIFARNPVSKVFPAMFIENITELAFDDVTPDDPDFPSIQGLAEAGLISSKLSYNDEFGSVEAGNSSSCLFSPDSPLSRQDLVSWKIALEKRHLPEVNKKMLWKMSGFIDIDKISQDAWPAILADLTSGEQSIISVAFGHTRLFQPDKPVTKAQAAVALATGEAAELVTEELARLEAESLADAAVAAHAALEAQVQKDLNDSFKRELELEREKIKETETLAEEARLELEKIKAQRDEEKYSLLKKEAAVDAEVEFLRTLKDELEKQYQTISTKRAEMSLKKNEIDKLRDEAEDIKIALDMAKAEVEIEKEALALARAWAEEEARNARAYAKELQEAREKWERQGIQIQVDKELDENNTAVLTWQYSPKVQKDLGEAQKDLGEVQKDLGEVQKDLGESPFHEIIVRAEEIRGKLGHLSNDLRVKILAVIEKLIHAIGLLITSLRQKASQTGERVQEFEREALAVASKAAQDVQQRTASSVAGVTSSITKGTKRLVDECREGAEKISQKFKT